MPLSTRDMRKSLKRLIRASRLKVEKELALILGFKEIQSEEIIGRYLGRLKELELQVYA